MRYLILGLGFLSTHIAEYISKYGEVTVTYRSLERVKEVYYKLLREKGVNFVKLDPLNNLDLLKRIIESNDVIINTIGKFGNVDVETAHVEIPKKVAENVQNQVLIHVSSAAATGLTGEVKEEDEHCKNVSPKTPYEISKCEGEKAVMKIAKEKGFPLAIIRPTFIYGKYGAHVHFVLMYWLSKFGIVPSMGISLSTISANRIAEIVRVLAEAKPRGVYMYAHECELVNFDRFFEIMAEALGRKKVIKLPMNKNILPPDFKCTLKYSGTRYDCTRITEYIGKVSFDEKEVSQNALFMDYLRRSGLLLAT
ncbi:NAD-dependent epimerase/dehydratase family protein [Acidianus infernus]|uniref:NAD-dependent epimerase/dehydratase family protein n=1 Tax=Acidianus infernus TaxID=12915 RepID=A0A6A9QIE3_ACIIN|nr:NAD(P)-dependent oxidoreductase [Acidianus infernus]MUM65020.1 NAD-dependent epimerase/dehydratase family protein [Acidianus infernus]